MASRSSPTLIPACLVGTLSPGCALSSALTWRVVRVVVPVTLHGVTWFRRLAVVSEAAVVDPEDLKIISLARSARVRVAAAEGAAVRDETGRTYAAAAVALPSLQLSALRLAVAMAASSGADGLEAAAVVTE